MQSLSNADAVDNTPCKNCSIGDETVLNADSAVLTSSLPSLLFLDKKCDPKLNSKKEQPRTKPNICKLPASDVMARMKAFMPNLSKPMETLPAGDDGSAVQFVPMSDSESNSDSDSESESEDQGPHVEMRLALVPDETSDSDDELSNGTDSVGQVTAENLRLPGQTDEMKIPPSAIQELN